MKEEKFKIIQFIRELIVIVDKELDNFPKKDIELSEGVKTLSLILLNRKKFIFSIQQKAVIAIAFEISSLRSETQIGEKKSGQSHFSWHFSKK